MSRAGLILLLCRAAFAADTLVVSNNAACGFFFSSYDAPPYKLFTHYFASGLQLANPTYSNHFFSASAGGNLQDANQRLEKWGLARLANASQSIVFIGPDDNGGFTYFQTMTNLTNTIRVQTNGWFNGTDYVREGGAANALNATVALVGVIPHDSADGDSGQVDRNQATVDFGVANSVPFADMRHLWTNGWSADVVGARHLGFFSGSHPYAAGHLAMAIQMFRSYFGSLTNLWDVTLDWNTRGIVSTNSCTIPAIGGNDITLTWTQRLERMAMGWDVPDGTITNDARGCFTAIPSFGNAIWEKLVVNNAPDGNYVVALDGSNIVTTTGAQLRSGFNFFTNYTGAFWAQRKKVLEGMRDSDGSDHVTLLDTHTAGEPGLYGQEDQVRYRSNANARWTAGDRGDTLISALNANIAGLNVYDATNKIWATQTNHTLALTWAGGFHTAHGHRANVGRVIKP